MPLTNREFLAKSLFSEPQFYSVEWKDWIRWFLDFFPALIFDSAIKHLDYKLCHYIQAHLLLLFNSLLYLFSCSIFTKLLEGESSLQRRFSIKFVSSLSQMWISVPQNIPLGLLLQSSYIPTLLLLGISKLVH